MTLDLITIYFIIGTLFIGFLDIANAVFTKSNVQIPNVERFIGIMIWPVLFLKLIYKVIINSLKK